MVERKLLVDEEGVSYEGLFDIKELYKIIDEFLTMKGYDKFEPMCEESIYPSGKEILIKITPKKWWSDYIRKMLKIEIQMHNVREVETSVDGVKMKLNQGKMLILYSCYLETDWEARFEQRPIYYFWKTIFDKFVYKKHTQQYEDETIADMNELREKMGAYLNLYRFRKAL
ncbi:hypothetical protein KY362_01330 [Candidatus Woesearchaeota archaeon]|nr:hypothetical protein [Candidatus Woesearchaeota archaeon]